MSKYLSLLKYEARTIVRDPINLYMCLFPIIVLILSSFVFPMIFESFDPMQEAMLKAVMLLLLVVILAFGSYFLAAMATFLLLEQKDEHTLNTIAVTPIGASGYLKLKMAYIYLMSVIGNIAILLGTKLIAGDRYTVLGMLALVPALMILEAFQGGLQYVLGIFPNFWAIKGILVSSMPVAHGANLSYPMYLLVGGVYDVVLSVAAYRLFSRGRSTRREGAPPDGQVSAPTCS
jgi:hypothetical protein